jgi:hypothetical protein
VTGGQAWAVDLARHYLWIEGEFDSREVFLRLLSDGAEIAGD